MFLNEIFNEHLKIKKFKIDLKYLSMVDSTNKVSWEYPDAEENNLLIFLTKNQTKGKGRRGNTWYSTKNKSLTFSIKKKYNEQLDMLISYKIGISIIEAIENLCKLQCKLKWPNDIIYNKQKMGGILIEKKDTNLVIGVGINVNENEENLNLKINKDITSLKINTNSNVVLETLLAEILNSFELNYFNLSNSKILENWNKKCAHINKKIKFHRNKNLVSGIFKGLNDNGQAIIKMKNKIHFLGGGLIKI